MNNTKHIENKTTVRKSNKEAQAFTRECIRTALFYLLKNNSFDKITVTSIIKRAGVSRAGFYRNYDSKEAVLEDIAVSIFNQLFDNLFKDMTTDTIEYCYLRLFQKIAEYKEWFKIISTLSIYNSNIFNFSSCIKRELPSQTSLEYYSSIAAFYSQSGIILDWYRNGMKETPEEMAAIFCKLYTPHISI